MNEGWLIIGMMAVTFSVRYLTLAWVGKFDLPEVVVRGLGYVPPAVLTAIIVPGILLKDGRLFLHVDNSYLIAGIAAALIAWWRKNLLLTIIGGMAVFFLWRWLVIG